MLWVFLACHYVHVLYIWEPCDWGEAWTSGKIKKILVRAQTITWRDQLCTIWDREGGNRGNKRNGYPAITRCWASVADGGTTLHQHWVIVWCLQTSRCLFVRRGFTEISCFPFLTLGHCCFDVVWMSEWLLRLAILRQKEARSRDNALFFSNNFKGSLSCIVPSQQTQGIESMSV